MGNPTEEELTETPRRSFPIFELEPEAKPDGLHAAAAQGLVGELVKMVESSIELDIDKKDRFSRTALHWAVDMGNLKAVEALLDLGADPGVRDVNGRTCIHLAARAGFGDVLELILGEMEEEKVKSMVNCPDLTGMTPVFLARGQGEAGVEAFKVLMSKGANYMSQELPAGECDG